jgi:hypothetical protein
LLLRDAIRVRLSLELRGVGATSRDVFGVDDLRFRPAAVTPEPATLLPAVGGLMAAGLRWAGRRRRG